MNNAEHLNPINPNESELGQKTTYDQAYNPDRLFPISRKSKREEIGIDPNALPFFGFDCWNHYEVSWLNQKGKPIVAIAEIIYHCDSPAIIESKSLKLYFNSLNNTTFESWDRVKTTVTTDLERCIGAPVTLNLFPLNQSAHQIMQPCFSGESLDNLDIECSIYTVEPTYLSVGNAIVNETLCSDLLKSNCLVTNQPDWGSVQISYTGNQIHREGLLQYLVSFRNHNEFHEQCIERIFIDILRQCNPQHLTVSGRYTRRGGLDINPYRTTEAISHYQNMRLIRQ